MSRLVTRADEIYSYQVVQRMVHMKSRIMKQVMYGVIHGVLNMLC